MSEKLGFLFDCDDTLIQSEQLLMRAVLLVLNIDVGDQESSIYC